MNQKTLIGLAVATLLALLAAFALNRSNQPRSESDAKAATWLVPGLRDHVNEVDRVVLTGADNKVLATMARAADGWTLAEKGGYSVDTGKLRAFLLKLAEAKLIEQKTANKDKYALLGVEDMAEKDAKGLQIELGGLAGPVKLVLGNNNPRGGGNFVRRADEAQSWLASGSLTVEKNAADWLSRELTDIAPTRLKSVDVTHADGSNVRIAKESQGDANFKLVDLPKGREAASEFSTNALATMLDDLRFDDVLPAADAVPADNALKARYAAFDGLLIEATAWKEDDKHYARFSASLDATQADAGIDAAQAKAKAEFEAAVASSAAGESKEADAKSADAPAKPLALTDPAKDRETRLAALNQEVASLGARFKGWTFVVPAHKYANIDKPLDELLKPLEEKKVVVKKKAG
jgi:hypothetical protein